jgi:hypothetical protein
VQTVLGTVISALTGSEDPSEVATMAKQATEVSSELAPEQGCQMVYFQTKNPTLGKFGRVLPWTMLVYFMVLWSIFRPVGIFYGHLAYFLIIWYISPRFGMLYQEKSGIPAPGSFVTCDKSFFITKILVHM